MTIAQTFSIDPHEFSGKRVLVTGGTKGTGAAIVRRLAAAGASVATTARSPSSEGSPVRIHESLRYVVSAIAYCRWLSVTASQPQSAATRRGSSSQEMAAMISRSRSESRHVLPFRSDLSACRLRLQACWQAFPRRRRREKEV